MKTYEISFTKVHELAQIPTKAHPEDAGFDLYSVEDVLLKPGEYKKIRIGICLQLPQWTEAQIRPRSGLAAKFGITVLNTPGTIDAGYRGEIQVILINHGKTPFAVEAGMRVAQMVIQPVCEAKLYEVLELDMTSRGVNGFGLT